MPTSSGTSPNLRYLRSRSADSFATSVKPSPVINVQQSGGRYIMIHSKDFILQVLYHPSTSTESRLYRVYCGIDDFIDAEFCLTLG